MKKTVILLLFIVTVITGGIYIMRYREDKNYRSRGQYLINKIECYRKIHRQLPKNVGSMGLEEPMSDGPFYEKIDNNTFRVYFCVGFDTYKVYNSKNRQWTFERE